MSAFNGGPMDRTDRIFVGIVVAILLVLVVYISTACIKLPTEMVIKHCIAAGGTIGQASDSIPCANMDSLNIEP